MPLVGHKIETTSADFGVLVRDNCLLVDKTLMIKTFFDGQNVSLITRPRRFGKTLNLSMLQHFFSATVTGMPTEGLFDSFAIAKEDNGRFIKQHQGRYPVIFISFKDTKEPSFNATLNQIRNLVQALYREHRALLLSDKIDHVDADLFQKYLEGTVNNEQLQSSLKFLSEFLYKAHEQKPIILIDEYDTPLTNAYQYQCLDAVSDFMRDMFSTALKDNPFLQKGLMTGILRVSKNNMLSGLNNLESYTLLDKQYAPYFGFTEEEVSELIRYTSMTEVSLANIRSYYNGYQMGDTVIYNPWSIMKFLYKKELAPYWVLTSNDWLLKNALITSNDETRALLGDLMQENSIIGSINANLRYEDLMEDPDTLWTLLLFCGYLTFESKTQDDLQLSCQLKIPNREILAQYKAIFKDWLKEKLGSAHYKSFLTSLVCGNVDEFTRALSDYLMHSLSVRDVGGNKQSERFYHGFVTGLIASVRDTHWVDSNKESGNGLYDVMLIPKDTHAHMGIILEFKHAKTNQSLKKEALVAINQIEQLNYVTELTRYPHIKDVLKVGLSFCEKAVISAYQIEVLATRQSSAITWSQPCTKIL